MSLRPYQNLAADWIAVPDVWEYRNGDLYWRINCGRGSSVRHVGDKVVVKGDLLGYQYVTWQRKHYAVHRVVFLLTQKWLPDCIDHIDGNPSNNNAANLRAATRLQNQHNRKANVKSKTGIKNVTSHQGKWAVRFSVKNKTVYVGCYDDIEFAELVACEMRSLLHKEFARHV